MIINSDGESTATFTHAGVGLLESSVEPTKTL